MQTFAYVPVVPGPVVSLFEIPDGATLAACVAPAFAINFFACDATITGGWSYDGKIFTAPASTPALTPVQLIVYANAKQIALRDGGITVNVGSTSTSDEVNVASDANGRTLVTGCIQLSGLAAQNGQPAPSFQWINNDGTQLTLTAAQMATIGLKLGGFVQATYATLGTVLASIANGTTTTMAQVDAAAWPATSY